MQQLRLYLGLCRNGFNPCFNGSCSRISPASSIFKAQSGFNPCFNGSCSRMPLLRHPFSRHNRVSILVLMDLARECEYKWLIRDQKMSFNPCFNGSCSRMLLFVFFVLAPFGFNPCFNGSCSRITGTGQ